MAPSSCMRNITKKNVGYDVTLQMCYCSDTSFFKYVPILENGCCTCDIQWMTKVGAFVNISSIIFLTFWTLALIFFSLNLRHLMREKSGHYRLFCILGLMSALRMLFWIDCRGMRGILPGGFQYLIHYIGYSMVLLVNLELLLDYEHSMLYINGSSQSQVMRCELLSKLFASIFLLALTIIGLYSYIAYFILKDIDFMTWYTWYVRVWRYIYGIGLLICALLMSYQSTVFQNKVAKQRRVQKREEKEEERIRRKTMKKNNTQIDENGKKKKNKGEKRRTQAVATPKYIITLNTFLFFFGISEIVGFSVALILASFARTDPVAYIAQLTLIDALMVAMTFWAAGHFSERKHCIANFPCLKHLNTGSTNNNGKMQVYDSSNERRQKRSTKKKSKGGSKYGNDRQSKWNRSGKSNRKTRKSKRRSNNNNIVTESPIHEINISDINEDNCDKMLDKVLELANLEMIEINSTNNNSTNDDDEDAINTFSDDDSNEQYDLETDDSCEFDEEYSFDNVRRVALSNRGRRVSIYDMEFDNNDQTNNNIFEEEEERKE